MVEGERWRVMARPLLFASLLTGNYCSLNRNLRAVEFVDPMLPKPNTRFYTLILRRTLYVITMFDTFFVFLHKNTIYNILKSELSDCVIKNVVAKKRKP